MTLYPITTAISIDIRSKTRHPAQLKLLLNSTGLSLACPSPSSVTSSLTLPPFAATTVLLLLSPLFLGVLQGVVPISPNTSSSSPDRGDALGVKVLQLYKDESVGYKGETMVGV